METRESRVIVHEAVREKMVEVLEGVLKSIRSGILYKIIEIINCFLCGRGRTALRVLWIIIFHSLFFILTFISFWYSAYLAFLTIVVIEHFLE